MVISKELANALDSLSDAFKDAEEYFRGTPCSEGMSVTVNHDLLYEYTMEIREDGKLVYLAEFTGDQSDYVDGTYPEPRFVSSLSVEKKKLCADVLPDLIARVRKESEGYPAEIESLAEKIRKAL